MTPEQRYQLRLRLWRVNAKPIRPSVSKVIAEAVGGSPTDFAFTDFEETNRIADLFSSKVEANTEIELPDRQAAIDYVIRELHEVTGLAYLLVEDYHQCGAIILDFAMIIDNLDKLLKNQNECFRIISADGKTGCCLFAQEGTAPLYPRYVTLWRA
jgi:hypothetical protein